MKMKQIEEAFSLIEEHDLDVGAVFVPKGKAGDRVIRDIREWKPIPKGVLVVKDEAEAKNRVV